MKVGYNTYMTRLEQQLAASIRLAQIGKPVLDKAIAKKHSRQAKNAKKLHWKVAG